MKQKRSLFMMVLCFAVLLAVGSYKGSILVAATEAPESTEAVKEEVQYCGKTATWTYDANTKILAIQGTGKMEGNTSWRKLDIKKLKVCDGITEVSPFAFSHLEKLEQAELSNGIKKLGYDVFYYCTKLRNVNIPTSLTSLPREAFENCRSLKQIEIPSNITSIGSSCFFNTALETVEVPSSVKYCGSSVFANCKSLKKVILPTKNVPSYAFQYCSNLTDITLAKNVETIGTRAFAESGIETFTVPETVKSLGSNAFQYCKKLRNITFTKGIKEIPAYVLSGAKNVDKVVIQSGITKISSNAFRNCGMEAISIPSTVESFGNAAFMDCKNLKSITIPSKATVIRINTFKGCKSLERVMIGKGVKKIGESSFEGCKRLKGITIPSNVETIGYRSFAESGLRHVNLTSGVKSVGYWAFNNCSYLKSVSIGDKVTSIRDNAFTECNQLTTIAVSSKNPNYSSVNGALYSKYQSKLVCCPAGKTSSFKIAKNVQTIGDYAFYKCSKIKAYQVEDGSRYVVVKDGLLYNKYQTELLSCPVGKTGEVVIARGVTKIRDYAFQNSKASKIILPDTLREIGYCVFENCNKLESIRIPGSVKTISNAAFWGCEKLYYVEMMSGVKNVEAYAFNYCRALRIVKIPASVSYISSSAFNGSDYRMTIYCKKSSYAMSYAGKHYINCKVI